MTLLKKKKNNEIQYKLQILINCELNSPTKVHCSTMVFQTRQDLLKEFNKYLHWYRNIKHYITKIIKKENQLIIIAKNNWLINELVKLVD